MKTLTIGQVAKLAEIGVETVRFYERRGLLDEPDRKPSGYRQFPEDAVRRLRFIRRAKQLGFSLKEIKDLLGLKLDPGSARGKVRQQAEQKIVDIERRIEELQQMKKALLPLIKACDGKGSLEGCPILRAIEEPDFDVDGHR